MLIDNALTPAEEEAMEVLLARYQQLGEEIQQHKILREEVAKQLVHYLCPFKIGQQVYIPKPSKHLKEPKGKCQVVEVLPLGHASAEGESLERPSYYFKVRKVLSNGTLSNLSHTTHMPGRWRSVK